MSGAPKTRRGIRTKALPETTPADLVPMGNNAIDVLATAVDPAAKTSRPIPEAARANVPDGYKLTTAKTFLVKEKEEGNEYVPLCGPLWVIGRTTGAHGEWGLVLAFIDHDGTERELAIPAARLHEDSAILSRELATLGLQTIPGNEKKILAYLASWDIGTRILSAKRLGWLEDREGAMAFVMPDRVISRDGAREIVYQPDRYSPTVKTVHASGTLADWQHHVAAPACKHPPMLFSLCAGLAPAFLAFGEAGDSFIIHFWGRTSRGKTTLGQIAASPWGCAADPADAPSLTFVRRWNLTANGLEGLAEAHSDLPLVLDELGSSTVGDIRPLVYQLSGGQGKAAMNSAREMKEPRSWRTVAISTGEVSLHGRMADPHGDGRRMAVKGGLTHRALDIELMDIASASPAPQRGGVVSALKVACARYYGTAGPELVRLIAAHFGSLADARAYMRHRLGDVMAKIAPAGLPVETERAARRFALVAVAGVFAAEARLIPASADDVIDATSDMLTGWLGAAADTDDERIIASVRDFILRHEARFQPINEPDLPPRVDQWGNEYTPTRREPEPVRDRVGFVDRGADRWMFTDAGLSEAAPGHDLATIAKALRGAGHLFTNDTPHLRARCTVPGFGSGRPRLYVVHGNIVTAEKFPPALKNGGTGGTSGTTPVTTRDSAVPLAENEVGQVGQQGGTGPLSHSPVPPVPPAIEQVGQPSGQQPRGVVPPVPAVPPKKSDSEKFPGNVHDNEEVF